MSSRYETLQEAVFDRFETKSSWSVLATKHRADDNSIRRAYKSWMKHYPESQPLTASDVKLDLRQKGRPCILSDDEEKLVVKALGYFVRNNTPLMNNSLQDLVEHYFSILHNRRQNEIKFKSNRPSTSWVDGFLKRHDLVYKAVRVIDDKHVQAVSEANVAEHIAHVKAAMDRYRIKDARFVFNMDQSGASFAKMTGRSLRKGVGPRNVALIHSAVRTKGNLERVTVMPVVSASGVAFKPVIVYPGKQAHYRKVSGHIQTLHGFLPPCYFYQREVPGVDSAIIFQWAKDFVNETKVLRSNGQRLLFVIDGYGSHVQFNTLQLFRENDIIVIALPAHTSHVLQPLDVSVFSSYKSYLQREIHTFAQRKKLLDAFDIAMGISRAYTKALTTSNIVDGFIRTGLWECSTLTASIEPLVQIFLMVRITQTPPTSHLME